MSQLKNSKLRCPVCLARQDILHPKTQDVRETAGYVSFVKRHLHNTRTVEVNGTCLMTVTVNPAEEGEQPTVDAQLLCKACGAEARVQAWRDKEQSVTFDAAAVQGFSNAHEGCVPPEKRS